MERCSTDWNGGTQHCRVPLLTLIKVKVSASGVGNECRKRRRLLACNFLRTIPTIYSHRDTACRSHCLRDRCGTIACETSCRMQLLHQGRPARQRGPEPRDIRSLSLPPILEITDYWKHCSNLPTPGHHAPESRIVPETSALHAHTEHCHKLSLSMRSGFMEYRFDTVARCFNLDAEHIGRFSKRVPIG